jgi:hypothetical protein
MTPCRSLIDTVPVWTTGWPAKLLLAGISVHVPLKALWSLAYAANPKSSVAAAAASVVDEKFLMLSGRARATPLAFRLLLQSIMYQLMLASSGLLFVGSAGAFFLYVPLLSIATVVLMLLGLTLMFGLGFQAGFRRQPHAHLVGPAVIHELNR